MHILIVYQYYLRKDKAGGSRWNEFAKYWAEAGCKVTVLAGMFHYGTGKKSPEHKGKYIVTEFDEPDVVVKCCHVSEAYYKGFLGRIWAYFSFTVSSTIAGLPIRKPDVIICSSPSLTVGLTGWALSKLKRVPMIFEVRDLWPESPIESGALTNKWMIKLGYWLERFSYCNAAWINVLTPAFEEVLVTRKGVSREKMSMIPNAADLDIIKPGPRDNWVREKYNLEDKFVVAYVGAHGPGNALMQLIEAAKILKKRDKQVQLMLVGNGVEKPKLIKEAKARGLDNVTFVAQVPKTQISDYINASDVCTAVLKK